MQGPELWLNELGIELQCVVDPDSRAMLDIDHRVLVNWDAYFFSGPEAMTVFRQEPWEFAGPVTDPVSQARFELTVDSPSRKLEERTFYFESEKTLAQYDADPEMYELPMIGMVKKD